METLPFLFVTVLAVCLMPSASALKCYACASLQGDLPIPGFAGKACNSDTSKMESIECPQYANRCMTMTGTVNIPGTGSMEFEMRNCSLSLQCEPDSQLNPCNVLKNTTDMFQKCNLECCEGDLCTQAESGAVRITGLVTSFAAIVLTVVLNLFPGFY